MKAWEVVLLEEAGADLLSGRAFYDQHGEHVGDYFFQSVLADISGLSFHAGVHARRLGCHRMLCSRFPYAVYYTKGAGRVEVLAVLDMRRSPGWIRRSLLARRGQ